MGAEYVVHLPPMFRDEKTGDYADDRVLSAEAWNRYIANADRLGRIMKEDYGLKMVLHPHGDSHIETPADIDRVFQATDPEYVGDLIEALADLDKELYVVCEQDLYGSDKGFPLPNAVKTRECLASLGLGRL